ncbi:MAG: prepilin peptidase [Rhodococcus sp.]|nr:prepilin peptidase [Rhodococcus sp. (in: high G+C Gram-positive bacteria)]
MNTANCGSVAAPAEVMLALVLVGWCVSLCVTDLRAHRLPNYLTLPGFAAVLGYAAYTGQVAMALAYGIGLAALHGAVWWVSPGSMGAGDVKLALGLGAVSGLAGPAAWMGAAIAAPVITAIWGIASFSRTGGRVPHGPSMCVATLGALGLAVWG